MPSTIHDFSSDSAPARTRTLAVPDKFHYLVGMQPGARNVLLLAGSLALSLATHSALAQTAPAETAAPAAAPLARSSSAPAPGAQPPAPNSAPAPGAQPPAPTTTPAPGFAAQLTPPPEPPLIQIQKDPPLPPPVMRTDHVHDGFYARLSLGFGQLGTTMNAPESGAIKGDGSTLAIDLSLGYAVSPGIVIGGMVIGEQMPSVELDAPAPVVTDVGAGMLGAFFDGYPDPRGGFHLGGGLGLAETNVQRKQAAGFKHAGGLGLAGWLGYDIWVADQWSTGLLVRFMGTRTRADADETENNLAGNATMATRSISLLLTGLYN